MGWRGRLWPPRTNGNDSGVWAQKALPEAVAPRENHGYHTAGRRRSIGGPEEPLCHDPATLRRGLRRGWRTALDGPCARASRQEGRGRAGPHRVWPLLRRREDEREVVLTRPGRGGQRDGGEPLSATDRPTDPVVVSVPEGPSTTDLAVLGLGMVLAFVLLGASFLVWRDIGDLDEMTRINLAQKASCGDSALTPAAVPAADGSREGSPGEPTVGAAASASKPAGKLATEGAPPAPSASAGAPQIVCGDGSCNGLENKGNCPTDCAQDVVTCGDHVCDDGEASSCPRDCQCGNGKCDPGESFRSCSADCRKVCPRDMTCPAPYTCEKNGHCIDPISGALWP